MLAELGDPNDRNQDVSIVLTAPDCGAILWTAALTGTLNVVAFEERQGTVYVGASHVVPALHAGRDLRPVGLVHVGGDRYVLGWIESTGYGGEETSLYATTIDLTGDAMRLARPRAVLPVPTARTRPPRRRCV